MHSPPAATGSFTYGGTESIILAVKAARDYYRKSKGTSETPEIVVPATIHPSFYKAADYLCVKVKKVGIDENKKADVEAVKEAVSGRTALIAVSAPNWPYGTIDPVRDIAEIAVDSGTLLHVDACLGGFILPFFEMLGENVEQFDFRVDGVTSISMDVHKYGYSPKGASVVLFRNPELKKYSMYVDVSSPGYIFVNTAVLSSRSVGPLAAAYAVIRHLGRDGYLRMARKVLSARDKIYRGMKNLGFESVAPIESSVLALANENLDLFAFVKNMRTFGWHFHLQRGMREFGIPPNIHLTLSPIHDKTADEFLRDAEKAMSAEADVKLSDILDMLQKGEVARILEDFESGRVDSSIATVLLENIPEEVAVEIVKDMVVRWYS